MNKQKGSILVILLLLLLAGTGLVFVGYKYVFPKISQVIPTPTPTSTPDPTADWKTYTNSDYGFSFKYPENIFSIGQFKVETPQEPSSAWSKWGSISLQSKQENTSFAIAAIETNLTVDQWMETQGSCPTSFDSCKQYPPMITGSKEFESINRHYSSLTTLIKHNGFIFDIEFAINEPNQKPTSGQINIFDQILSTFQFLK